MSALARAVTSLRLRAADLADTITGRRDPLTPPRRLSLYVGHGDFKTTGEEFVALFEELANLDPADRVLDIGCGIGRMARTLVPILKPPGSYDGFDVAASGIGWCRAHYQNTPVPFRFRHADLRNDVYNPNGTTTPATFTFPYDKHSFDLVLATSVFTHLLPDAAERYVAETARVLAPSGRLFCTWFLADDEAGPPQGFTRDRAHPPASIADPLQPEAAVVYPREWVLERLRAHSLHPDPIHNGSWTGRPGTTLQDIVVARANR